MTTETLSQAPVRRRPVIIKTLLNGVWMTLLGAALIFIPAGRLDLPMFWIFLAAQFLYFLLVSVPLVAARDPEMMQERIKPAEPIRGKHLFWRLGNKTIPRLALVVAGLDVGRFHWSDSVPLPVQIFALVAGLAGLGLVSWSMYVNTFFSNAVRVQHERGHRVISRGPYQLVRHPGYVGMLTWYLTAGIALGSWWAVVPGIATIGLYVIRTRMEENLLLGDLDGYRDYATRVRYRLMPGVW